MSGIYSYLLKIFFLISIYQREVEKQKVSLGVTNSSLLNRVLGVLVCSRALRAFVITCLACLHAYVLGRACVLTCLVFAYLRAWCARVRACVVVTMKCFIFLRVCALGVWCAFCLICFTFQYLNLKILRANKLCALLS